MRRMLYESRMVPRPAGELEQALLQRGPELLAAAAGSPLAPGGTAVDGSFEIDLPAHWAGVDFAKRVQVTLGVARHMDGRLLLPVSWAGEPGRHLFPVFDGTLEVGPMFRELSELTLAGSYRVPLGPVGAALDVAVLHAAARDTAARLVQGLAAVLTSGELPPAPPPPRDLPASPLRVRHVMSPDPLVVAPGVGLRHAARVLLAAGVSAVPVVAEDGALVGVLSEHDLLAKEARRRYGFGSAVQQEQVRRDAVTAGQACTSPARVIAPGALVSDAARQMLDHRVNRLVVVDHGAIVGIVSRRDVLRALVRDSEQVAAAVEAALAALGADGARVQVSEDGLAVIGGTVRLRSVAAQVHAVAAGIEGVVAVDTRDLRYQDDDVLAIMPMV